MRRTVFLLLAGALLGAPAAASAATATDEMTACAALGRKQPGNAAGVKMADHLVERFRAAGLETTVESFHLPVHVVRAVKLEVLGPSAREVPGETFAYGGSGAVEAGVVDVGVGRPSDYAGVDAKGKIVMVDRNEAYHRSSQLNEVEAHGGAAMLYVSGSPDNLVQTGTVRFAQRTPPKIPTVTVGADDGAALRAELEERGLEMRVTVDAAREDAIGRNVIGVKRGAAHPDRYVVVGGHYDSWHGGAVDNCSGIGSMLALVEALRDVEPAYTVIFGAWDAEEVGLTGSYDWVMRHPELVKRTVLNENLEMTSAATYVGGNRLDYSLLNLIFGTANPAMNALVYSAAGRNAFAPAPTTAFGVRQVSGGIIPTDLQPFYASGVQGFSTFSSTPYYHTTEDGPDKIDQASLERVTAVLRDVLLDVQRVPPEALGGREVPTVTVAAPGEAAPGSAVPVEIRVIDPAGRPVTGARVAMLANQRDHWAVSEGTAEEVGDGVYRWTVPAGATDADRTWLTATVDQPLSIAQGFTSVDQRAGGVLAPVARRRTCRSRRRVVVHVPRRFTRVRASLSRGRVRVRGRRVTVDLRGVPRGTVRLRLTARDRAGRLVRQTRTYRTCVRRGS